MIIIDLYGRLGNQLFQYAVLRNISLIKNFDIYYNINFTWHNQKCLLDNFNIYPSIEKKKIKYHYQQKSINKEQFLEGGCCTYDDSILQIKDFTKLNGHFVNEKYFYQNKDIIKKELTVKNLKIKEWGEKYIKNLKKDDRKIIGIHIRRGDDFEINNNFDEKSVFDFIKKVLDKINNKECILLLFIGGSRTNDNGNDIEWLNKNLGKYNNYPKIISPGSIENDPLKDYYLMSKCDIGIITRYSSFAWWAFYVNNVPNKKIYISKDNYAPAEEFMTI